MCKVNDIIVLPKDVIDSLKVLMYWYNKKSFSEIRDM
jgi:hypothetical protein